MALVWVWAKTIIRIEENGTLRTVHPGDWCQVGRQQAKELLANDQVKILNPTVLQTVQDLTDCTILLKGIINESQRGHIAAKFPGVPVEAWQGYPANQGRFLVWDMTAQLKEDLILTGFSLLNKWQLAVPLLGFDILADKVGTPDEQVETKAVIHDLRVPVYNPRVMFVRQCRETRQLFDAWQDGSELGFLRTLYQARPIVNALPPSWIL
jgi:hypothetical protein